MQEQTGYGDKQRKDVQELKDSVSEGEKNLAVLEVSIVGVLERFSTDMAKRAEEHAKEANARDWRLIIFIFVLVSIATSIILTVLGD